MAKRRKRKNKNNNTVIAVLIIIIIALIIGIVVILQNKKESDESEASTTAPNDSAIVETQADDFTDGSLGKETEADSSSEETSELVTENLYQSKKDMVNAVIEYYADFTPPGCYIDEHDVYCDGNNYIFMIKYNTSVILEVTVDSVSGEVTDSDGNSIWNIYDYID